MPPEPVARKEVAAAVAKQCEYGLKTPPEQLTADDVRFLSASNQGGAPTREAVRVSRRAHPPPRQAVRAMAAGLKMKRALVSPLP